MDIDINIKRQIEFDKVKELWSSYAVTDDAVSRINDAYIIYEESLLRKELRDTSDARELIEKNGNPPLQNVSEVRNIVESAKKGERLSAYELERVATALSAVKRLKDYLNRGKAFENGLAFYEENLCELEELREEIGRQIRNGEVDDYASRDLAQIRSAIQRCDDEMRQNAEQILRTHKECMSDNFYTLKNGRVCVPVKKEYKLKISGSVIDKSATGSTFFIEPSKVAKCYEEMQMWRISEENEVYRILYTLSVMVADAAAEFEENIRMIEKLDFIFSKGKLSIDMKASNPMINTDRRIILHNAWHPLMHKADAVPLQFELKDDIKGIVITGPNTGGKTVAIKTVMLNCIMAQCGLHVTCEEADICMNGSYLCDIGDGQSLSENLSTFSAHITNVLNIIKKVDKDSLVIMDELGSGTDPTEGMGIAIAILEELKMSGALFLVTTHYPDVKEYAVRTEGIVNAKMTFDKETLKPTYQMVIGEAGESCAFYIADRLGMPARMLKVAVASAYGEKAWSSYNFDNEDILQEKYDNRKIVKSKNNSRGKSFLSKTELMDKYHIGDSVMVFPDNKIGIVCEPINDKGVLRVQLPNKKIWINHKRVKLHVAATELYPENYDFSIIFESVENRKKLHDMDRKYTEDIVKYESDGDC